jgi:multidrug efflux pump subunit AcrA (membrane-fusion protein)
MILKPIKSLISKFKSASKKKKFLVIIAILILGFVVSSQLRKASAPPKYTLEAAKIDSITELVSETGNITAAGVTPIYSTTTGVVEEVYVSNGSYVAKNQELFKVKATATKQEKDSALATYLSAKSALETAKATQLSLQAQMFGQWDSFKELAQSDEYENADGSPKFEQRGEPEFHIPEKEWLAAEASYKKQQTVISQASAQVSATWQAYQSTQDSKVISTIEGEVRNLGIAKGDMITISSPTGVSNPALILVDSSIQPVIKLNVNENDVLKIKEGQPATVEFDAISNQTFIGKVDRVDTIATPTADVVTFAVYVSITDNSTLIRSGLTADVDITVDGREGILTVPSSAIKPYQGGKAVRIVGANGEVEFVPVEVGIQGGGKTQIISGIEEGTQVITALADDQVERSGGLF